MIMVKFNPFAWLPERNASTYIDNEQFINLHSDADAKVELLALIDKLVAQKVNITESYGDWVKVGFALAEELGEEGRVPFHQLSAQSSKYAERECEAKWRALLRANSGRVRGSTIFWLAEQAGIDIASH